MPAGGQRKSRERVDRHAVGPHAHHLTAQDLSADPLEQRACPREETGQVAALEAEMAVRPPPAGEVPLSRRLFSDESAWQSCVNTDNRMCISETAALQG